MSPYDKNQAQTLGEAIVQLIQAVSDGVQAEDADDAINLITSFGAASDEIQADRDAAVLDVLSGITSAAADLRRDPV